MSSLPTSAAWVGPLPEAQPPASLGIHHLPTGTYETRASIAVRGGTFSNRGNFASSAVLVRRPGG